MKMHDDGERQPARLADRPDATPGEEQIHGDTPATLSSVAAVTSHLRALRQQAIRSRSSRAIMLLSVLSGMGLLLAVAREAVTAYYFGASAELDAFLVALSAPQMIGTAFAAALVSTVLPEYVHLRRSQRVKAARHMARRWTKLSLMLTGGGAILLAGWAPLVVTGLAPGFVSGQTVLARALLAVLAGTIVFQGLSGVSKSVLNANRCFGRPALQGAAISALVVISCPLLAGPFGVWALVVGTVVAVAFAFALQATHQEFRAVMSCRTGEYRGRLSLGPFGVVLAATAAGSMMAPVDRWFASRLAPGVISQLNYATRLVAAPSQLLITPLVTVLLPVLSECFAGRDSSRLRRASFAGAAYCLAVCVPAVVVLTWFGSDIVRAVLGRGHFDAAAAAATGHFLRILAPAVLLNSLTWGLMQFLLAARRYDLQLGGQAARLALKVVAARLLVHTRGATGLPMSTIAASAAALPIYFALVRLAHKREFEGTRPGTSETVSGGNDS